MHLDSVGAKEWQEFLAEAEHPTPFHEVKWIRAIEDSSKWCARFIIAREQSDPVAGIPLFVTRRGPLRLLFSPPPGFGIPYLGPLIRRDSRHREAESRKLLNLFNETLADTWLSKWGSVVKLDCGPWVTDMRPFLDHGYNVAPRYSYYLDLSGGFEAAWGRVHKSLRADVRGACKNYSFREASTTEAEWVLNSVHSRYVNKGRSPRIHRTYLENLRKSLPGDMLKVFVVEKEGVSITGSLSISYRDTLFGWIGVPRVSPEHRNVNELLIHGTLNWATTHRLSRLDLVGANTPGVVHFKAKFNPRLVLYAEAGRLPKLASAFLRFHRSRESET